MDMNYNSKPVLVFPSINWEIYLHTDNEHNGYDKLLVDDYDMVAGGSSLTIARALIYHNCLPTLFGLVGENDRTGLTDRISQSGITFKAVDCLKKTNMSIIQRTVEGRELIYEHKSDLAEKNLAAIADDLKKHADSFQWRIGSGFSKELLFLKDLFDQNSNNILIPKRNLLQSEKFKEVLPLVNVVSFNKQEFAESKLSFKDFHKEGVDLVIVTNNSHGGEFSFHGRHESYKPYPIPESAEKFPTGAGDWFTSSTLADLINKGVKKIRDANFTDIRDAIEFAAKISAKKVLHRGASNNEPIRNDINIDVDININAN